MASMTTAQKNAAVKAQVVDMFAMPEGTVQVGDYTYAVPTEVEGSQRWAEVTFTAKNDKATKVTEAYDPYEKAEDWKSDKAFKAQAAEAKAKSKAEKVARAKAAKAAKGSESK